VTITVAAPHAANAPPTVFAGFDQTLTQPQILRLQGTVTDDGLPFGAGSLTTAWSQVSGPSIVDFVNTQTVVTFAQFSTPGTYVLRLTANDGALSASDDVKITVNAPPLTNHAPTVNAGSDKEVVGQLTTFLDGTVSDDGLPARPAW